METATFRHHIDELLAREPGHIFRRAPREFADVLDLDTGLEEPERFARLDQLFSTFVGPISEALSTRDGIRRLARERPDVIYLLPAIRSELRPSDARR
jgi:hypothetical protein